MSKVRPTTLAERLRARADEAEKRKAKASITAKAEELARKAAAIEDDKLKRQVNNAARAATDICVEAAWNGNHEVLLPAKMAHLAASISSAIGVRIRDGKLLTPSEIESLSKIRSDLAELFTLLTKLVSARSSLSLQTKIQSIGLNNWHSGRKIAEEIEYLADQSLAQISADATQLRSERISISQEIIQIRRAERELESLEVAFREMINTYLNQKGAFAAEYHSKIASLGGSSAVGRLRKIEIAGEMLAAMGISVGDPQEFFRIAEVCERRDPDRLRSLQARDAKLSAELTSIEVRLARFQSQIPGLLESISTAITSVRKNPTIGACKFGELRDISNQKAKYLKWGTVLPAEVPVTRSFLDWLSGLNGSRAKTKLLRHFERVADEGRRSCTLTINPTRRGVSMVDLDGKLRIAFPCDTRLLESAICSLNIKTTYRQLNSGDIQVRFSWT